MYGRKRRGFTMLEVLITITILGVIAAIAVPRFTATTARANTAKIQADLQVLDSAIQLYEMETGMQASALSSLKDYVVDVEKLKPPKGKCYVKGEGEIAVPAESYSVGAEGNGVRRAKCGNFHAGDFGS